MRLFHNILELGERRRELRQKATFEEKLLWERLRNRKLGFKFKRQYSIGGYILDFYCTTERLCVELDGAGHFTDEGMEYDQARTAFLNSMNIKVIRFENRFVFQDPEYLKREIKIVLNKRNQSTG